MQLFLISALVIALIAVLFAVQNPAMVTIYFFSWAVSSSLALVLLVCLAIGVILSLLLSLPAIQKRNWQISKLKKKITDLEEEKLEFNKKITEQVSQINTLQSKINDIREEATKEPIETQEEVAKSEAATNIDKENN